MANQLIGYTGSGWRYPVGKKKVVRTYPLGGVPGGAVAGGGGGGGGGGVDPWAATIASLQTQIAALNKTNINKDPTLLAWQNERTQLAAENAAEQTRIAKQGKIAQGYATALAKLGLQSPDQVKAQYLQSAHELQGLGAGLTGTYQTDQQNMANQTVDAVNRMTGGAATGTGVGGYDTAGLANNAQLTGAVMPAASMIDHAQYAADAARRAAVESGWNVEGIAQQYVQKGIDARTAAGLEMKKLIAQRPELVAKVAAALQTTKLNAAKLMSDIVAKHTQAIHQQNADANAQRATDAQIAWLHQQGYSKVAGVTGYNPVTGLPTAKTVATQNADDIKWANAKTRNRAETNRQQEARGRLAVSYTNANHYMSDWQGFPVDQAGNRIKTTDQIIPVGPYKNVNGVMVRTYNPKTATANKPPSYSDISKLQNNMAAGIKARFPWLSAQVILNRQKTVVVWTPARIAAWLMRQYGNPYLSRYPGQKQSVQSAANELAASIHAQMLAKKRGG